MARIIVGQAWAHITFWTTDIATSQHYFGETLGMGLMSVQPVDDLEFCRYFFAWSTEELPVADATAVENRAWLWARPYALIDLQHLKQSGVTVRTSSREQSGFVAFSFGERAGGPSPLMSVADLDQLSWRTRHNRTGSVV